MSEQRPNVTPDEAGFCPPCICDVSWQAPVPAAGLTHRLLPQAALDTVVEGAELTGVVTRMMLYHGAQVDLGIVYDGCARALCQGLTECY